MRDGVPVSLERRQTSPRSPLDCLTLMKPGDPTTPPSNGSVYQEVVDHLHDHEEEAGGYLWPHRRSKLHHHHGSAHFKRPTDYYNVTDSPPPTRRRFAPSPERSVSPPHQQNCPPPPKKRSLEEYYSSLEREAKVLASNVCSEVEKVMEKQPQPAGNGAPVEGKDVEDSPRSSSGFSEGSSLSETTVKDAHGGELAVGAKCHETAGDEKPGFKNSAVKHLSFEEGPKQQGQEAACLVKGRDHRRSPVAEEVDSGTEDNESSSSLTIDESKTAGDAATDKDVEDEFGAGEKKSRLPNPGYAPSNNLLKDILQFQVNHKKPVSPIHVEIEPDVELTIEKFRSDKDGQISPSDDPNKPKILIKSFAKLLLPNSREAESGPAVASEEEAPPAAVDATSEERRFKAKDGGGNIATLSDSDLESDESVDCWALNEGQPYIYGPDGHIIKRVVGSNASPQGGENLFPCDYCDKVFSNKYHLQSHVVTHTGERSFACDKCGKLFGRKSTLRAHMTTHTKVSNFMCPLCGKACNDNNSLEEHIRMHTGEKPFVCEICNKAYARKSHLNVHYRVHTGERPFVCAECGKDFTEKRFLNDHMQTAHSGQDGPLKCPNCFREFAYKTSLKQHLKKQMCIKNLNRATHIPGGMAKQFQCPFCDKSYSWKQTLKQHVSMYHRNRIDTDEFWKYELLKNRRSGFDERTNEELWKRQLGKHADEESGANSASEKRKFKKEEPSCPEIPTDNNSEGKKSSTTVSESRLSAEMRLLALQSLQFISMGMQPPPAMLPAFTGLATGMQSLLGGGAGGGPALPLLLNNNRNMNNNESSGSSPSGSPPIPRSKPSETIVRPSESQFTLPAASNKSNDASNSKRNSFTNSATPSPTSDGRGSSPVVLPPSEESSVSRTQMWLAQLGHYRQRAPVADAHDASDKCHDDMWEEQIARVKKNPVRSPLEPLEITIDDDSEESNHQLNGLQQFRNKSLLPKKESTHTNSNDEETDDDKSSVLKTLLLDPGKRTSNNVSSDTESNKSSENSASEILRQRLLGQKPTGVHPKPPVEVGKPGCAVGEQFPKSAGPEENGYHRLVRCLPGSSAYGAEQERLWIHKLAKSAASGTPPRRDLAKPTPAVPPPKKPIHAAPKRPPLSSTPPGRSDSPPPPVPGEPPATASPENLSTIVDGEGKTNPGVADPLSNGTGSRSTFSFAHQSVMKKLLHRYKEKTFQ